MAWLVIFIAYMIAFLILPAMNVVNYDLPIASSLIVLMEQVATIGGSLYRSVSRTFYCRTTLKVRLLMKTYAFVRSNVPRVLNWSEIDEKPKLIDIDENNNNCEYVATSACPSFSCYLYFLFVPTLVYRDSYPRFDMVSNCSQSGTDTCNAVLSVVQGPHTSTGITCSPISRILLAPFFTLTMFSNGFAFPNFVTSTRSIYRCRRSSSPY